MKKESPKKQVKRKTTKKVIKKRTQKLVLNKYSLHLQALSVLIVLITSTIYTIGIIDLNLMLDLFCISILALAISLFPKRK